MKESGTTHWISPNNGATDNIGFNALPGVYRAYYGSNFGYMGYSAYFWPSTENNNSQVIYRRLHHDSPAVFRENIFKASGFSVRCVKDE